MKKRFASFLLLFTTTVSVFAQDNILKGDLIYGTVTENGQPVAGVLITERNANDRIMAQTITDVNGLYAFRLVNPRNTIVVTYPGYETVDFPIKKQTLDIMINKQAPLPPVELIDYSFLDIVDEYPTEEMINCWKSDPMSKNKPQDIYLPYRDNITYGSIQELFDNLYLNM